MCLYFKCKSNIARVNKRIVIPKRFRETIFSVIGHIIAEYYPFCFFIIFSFCVLPNILIEIVNNKFVNMFAVHSVFNDWSDARIENFPITIAVNFNICNSCTSSGFWWSGYYCIVFVLNIKFVWWFPCSHICDIADSDGCAITGLSDLCVDLDDGNGYSVEHGLY